VLAVKSGYTFYIHGCDPILQASSRGILPARAKRKLRRQAVKTTPHIVQGRGATLVPGTVNLLHHTPQKRRGKSNGDMEGCRLGLARALDWVIFLEHPGVLTINI
jgi:hypothetical protein